MTQRSYRKRKAIRSQYNYEISYMPYSSPIADQLVQGYVYDNKNIIIIYKRQYMFMNWFIGAR
jgi:hypothetical protein